MIKPLTSKKRIPFTTAPNSKQSLPESNKQRIFEFVHGSAVDPHPQKQQKGGEDALYVSNNIIVVADGVGGWKNFGVDAGDYSKNLIGIIDTLTKEQEKRMYYIQNPMKLAQAAVNLNKMPGSTTLSIATLHPKTGLLRTYCIGDSVYGIFHNPSRSDDLLLEPIIGQEQQYQFNHPFQVGSNFIHSESKQQMRFCDPSEGLYNQFSFNEISDTFFLLASDGIWDNLFVKQIHQIILSQMLHYKQSNSKISMKEVLQTNLHSETSNSDKNIKQLSSVDIANQLQKTVNLLIQETKKTYGLKQFEGPFYLKGRQLGLDVGKMAKVDDLSLVLAKIVQKEVN